MLIFLPHYPHKHIHPVKHLASTIRIIHPKTSNRVTFCAAIAAFVKYIIKVIKFKENNLDFRTCAVIVMLVFEKDKNKI